MAVPLEMSEEILKWSDYLYYCDTSPSGLRWKAPDRHYRKAHDPAGFITGKGYWRVRFKGKAYLVHRIICELHGMSVSGLTVDHIDRNPLNNTITNLRVVPQNVNCKNKNMAKNNKSGATGVIFQINKGKQHYWVAYWVDPRLKCPRQNKRFSILDLGYEEAKRKAIEYRLARIEEVTGYTEDHGLPHSEGLHLSVNETLSENILNK